MPTTAANGPIGIRKQIIDWWRRTCTWPFAEHVYRSEWSIERERMSTFWVMLESGNARMRTNTAYLLHDKTSNQRSCVQIPDFHIAVLASGINCIASDDDGQYSALPTVKRVLQDW